MKASFTNDPDVTYLKPRDTITEAELRTWHGFVGLLGGTVMISEPLNQPEYQQAARMYGILSPPVPDKGWSHKGGTDRNHEQFGFLAHRPWGDFAVVQLYNVGDEPAARRLDTSSLDPLGEVFHVWSFWDAKYLGLGKDDFQSPLLPPHGPILLRLTPVADPPEVPVLVGSDLHIGMGSAEMENIAADRDGIRLILNDGGAREGNLFIYSPRRLQMGEVRGCAVTGLADLGNSIWKISIAERKKTGLQIVHWRAVR